MKDLKRFQVHTLAELQRMIDHIEDRLEKLPIKYPNPKRLYRSYDEEEPCR